MVPGVPGRTAGFLGIAAIAAWAILYLVAAVSFPGYDITGNFLSDLGNPRAPTAWAFNAACIAGGLLFLPFGPAVGQTTGGRAGRLGGPLLGAAAVALVLVGVFPEESPLGLHFLVSVTFFLLLAVAAAVLAIPMHVSRAFGPVAGLLAGATVASTIVLAASGGKPLFEHLAVFVALAWTAWTAVRLARPAAA